jgi:hypothetical protein
MVQKGDRQMPFTLHHYCKKHQQVWVLAATAALGYALHYVTKAKMLEILRKAQADAAEVGKE